MTKIDFKSRYYEDFQKLRSIINHDKLFERGYNEDKQYYYTVYTKLRQYDKTSKEVAEDFYDSACAFFERELYRENEKQLLIENLLVYLND